MSQKFDKIEVDKNEKRFFEDVFEKKKLLLTLKLFDFIFFFCLIKFL